VICAAVDVGSNSAHLLVASIAPGPDAVPVPLLDESDILGLADVVDAAQLVPAAARDQLLATLVRFATDARDLGAAQIVFIGTEPLRRAVNARAIVTEVEQRTGAAFHVLSHEEEGYLTLLGATAGRHMEGPFVVADIGGGSSELVFAGAGAGAGAGAHPRTVGLRVGGARLSRAVPLSDPPTPAEEAVLLAAAREAVVAAPAAPGGVVPQRMIAVGGTASNLAKLVPDLVRDGVLDVPALDEALRRLAAAPAEEIGAARIIRPGRVRILPAGAAILRAIMERYGLDSVTMTDSGIREGLVLALAREGAAWRDQLGRLAREA
jgi:exopolyphosphatase / guanosine-5'-triphosphate,3'-diphosphate pyrophosphatase